MVSRINPELLAQLTGLRFKARSVVEGVLTGLHRSPHRGSSIEFSEHKEYSPGDEIKHIDWKVYAKTDKYYIKQFEDETNLRAYIVLDRSASMGYSSGKITKLDYAATLAIAIAFLLIRQQDAVGLLLFSDQIDQYIPAQSHHTHLTEIVESLNKVSPAGQTNIELALTTLSEMSRRRSLIFIISDLFDSGDRIVEMIRQLRLRKNEVTVLQILDNAEQTFPFNELIYFESMENQQRVLVDAGNVRERYLKEMQAYHQNLKDRFREADVDYAQVDTTAEPSVVLLDLLRGRLRPVHARTAG